MASKNFRAELVARAIAISATVYLFFYLLVATRYALTTALVGIVSAAQCAFLIIAIDRRNRVLTHFFQAVNHADYSQTYSFPAGASFGALRAEYLKAIEALKGYKLEKERRDQYIEMIAKSVGVGIIVFDGGGKVDFANEAFKSLLGTLAPRGLGELRAIDEALPERFTGMKNGETELLRLGEDRLPLLVSVRDIVLLREKYRIATIQNIGRELEANEMDAWQKLARVLTHEIMNSIAPVSSLAFTANSILSKLFGQGGEEGRSLADGERDAMSALEAIGKRSRSLLVFVESYRKLLRVPTPAPRSFPCEDMLDDLRRLMCGTLQERGIDFRLSVRPRGMRLLADRELVEQAIINLIKNSIEALQGNGGSPRIEIRAYMDGGGKPVIEVADNGPGIPADLQEKVFIPFFTTKGEGSGIGLSLCRQIMRLHDGSIRMRSSPGAGAAFYLRF